MDYKAIEQIIKTAGESGLNFLEIETEGIRITMQKGEAVGIVKKPKTETAVAELENETDTAIKIESEEETPKEFSEENDNIKIVASPIVGTFYGAGSPGAEPFVSIGTKIKKGQVLCIIEAMKLMNEIEAEFDGEIVEVLVKDEQMVEYGQQLYKVKVS